MINLFVIAQKKMLDVFIILRCPDKKNSNKGHFYNV